VTADGGYRKGTAGDCRLWTLSPPRRRRARDTDPPDRRGCNGAHLAAAAGASADLPQRLPAFIDAFPGRRPVRRRGRAAGRIAVRRGADEASARSRGVCFSTWRVDAIDFFRVGQEGAGAYGRRCRNGLRFGRRLRRSSVVGPPDGSFRSCRRQRVGGVRWVAMIAIPDGAGESARQGGACGGDSTARVGGAAPEPTQGMPIPCTGTPEMTVAAWLTCFLHGQ